MAWTRCHLSQSQSRAFRTFKCVFIMAQRSPGTCEISTWASATKNWRILKNTQLTSHSKCGNTRGHKTESCSHTVTSGIPAKGYDQKRCVHHLTRLLLCYNSPKHTLSPVFSPTEQRQSTLIQNEQPTTVKMPAWAPEINNHSACDWFKRATTEWIMWKYRRSLNYLSGN